MAHFEQWCGPYKEPTVCELTGQGRGAICVLGIIGEAALQTLQGMFDPVNGKALAELPRRKPVYGRWGAEDVIICIHGDHELELHCHGGVFAKQKIIADLQNKGFAFRELPASDQLKESSAAARIELAKASTRKSAAVLTWQVEGALERELMALEKDLAEEKLTLAQDRIAGLLQWAELGLHLTRPWKIAIAGAANAGKSSLINRIVGYSRSIVFDQPGTTRDLVTVETAIDGWPVKLIDTAGLRASDDQIEKQGMALAEQAVHQADLLIEVVDGSAPAQGLLNPPEIQHLVVINKCDIDRQPTDLKGMRISALRGDGIEELLAKISNRLVPAMPPIGTAVPFLPCQVDALRRIRNEITTA
ncbi:MAG: 50S ribosome-binding GTPase [Pirellulaceae bacterium]|nr:50S ribosome-binding GTPase [Pirellulaceae bacterium]